MTDLPRAKVWRHARILAEHVFDKLWLLDITLAEFRALLDEAAEVIEEVETDEGRLKELVLYTYTGHVRFTSLVVVDDARAEERLITVYEPSTDRWSDDFRRRR